VVGHAIAAEGQRLDHAGGSAPVAIDDVSVITLLVPVQEPIAAYGVAVFAGVGARRGARGLAVLDAAIVHQAVATRLEQAARRAAVSIEQVAILTLFGRGHETVAAHRAPEGAGIRALGGTRRLARFGFAVVDDAVATELHETCRAAAVAADCVAIIALLGWRSITIAAARGSGGTIARAKRRPRGVAVLRSCVVDDAVTAYLQRATRRATIAANKIAVIALLAGIDLAIAARRRDFDGATRGAPVTAGGVAIVAIFGRGDESVATYDRSHHTGIGADRGPRWLACFRAVVVHDPVTTELDRTA
jgi:hypothetical protein